MAPERVSCCAPLFTDQTEAHATVRAAFHCCLYAKLLDTERGLAFRIPGTRRETPVGLHLGPRLR